MLSQHALQVVSQPCSRSPGGYPSTPCRFPGPHPGGKLRGIWPGGGEVSRPKTKGEVEGDLARGVSRPTPGGGCSRGGLLPKGVPAPGGCGDTPPVMAIAVGGTHPTGMHSCFKLVFLQCHNCLGSEVTFPRLPTKWGGEGGQFILKIRDFRLSLDSNFMFQYLLSRSNYEQLHSNCTKTISSHYFQYLLKQFILSAKTSLALKISLKLKSWYHCCS